LRVHPLRCKGGGIASVTIDPRFNGPPGSGNGGYSCGRLAAFVDAPVAEVTLRLPPPLATPLDVARDSDGGVRLLDGEAVVAEARPAELAVEPPGATAFGEAVEAAKDSGFLDADTHPFPTCFVCGPHRHEGDGLRIFAGPLADGTAFAAPWTPDRALAGADGTLAPELVWAALDCPTSAPVFNDRNDPDFLPIVLARLAVEVLRPVQAGEPHTITSWRIAVDGRKRHAGAALHDADGELLAIGRALWIELKPQPPSA
jgi:hypothetical protein